MDKMWSWIEKNRFVLIGPVIAIMIWAYATSCTPLTTSLLNPSALVNAQQLELEFKTWQMQQEIMAAKFEAAGQDLAQQKANNEKIKETLLGLASGGIPDMPGLLKLLVTAKQAIHSHTCV